MRPALEFVNSSDARRHSQSFCDLWRMSSRCGSAKDFAMLWALALYVLAICLLVVFLFLFDILFSLCSSLSDYSSGFLFLD